MAFVPTAVPSVMAMMRRIMISRAIGFCLMPVDNRTFFIVVTPKDLRVLRRSCSPRAGSIVLLLHALLRGIQERIAVTWPIRPHPSLLPISLRATAPRLGATPSALSVQLCGCHRLS
jgi:hypothetical protein